MVLSGFNYYKCPKCEQLVALPSFSSGFSFGGSYGSTFYSDGSHSRSDTPRITKCTECETIYWLNRTSDWRLVNLKEMIEQNLEQPDMPMFLSLEGYISAIDSRMYDNEYDEVYFRKEVWWRFNDRVRNNEEQFLNESDESTWTENIKRLLTILEEWSLNLEINIEDTRNKLAVEDANEKTQGTKKWNNFSFAMLNFDNINKMIDRSINLKFMISEIYRNLGLFEKCLAILATIESENHYWIKSALEIECKNSNTKPVKIEQPMELILAIASKISLVVPV